MTKHELMKAMQERGIDAGALSVRTSCFASPEHLDIRADEFAVGAIPKTRDDILSAIRRCQPSGAEPMELDDVYLVFGEAGSDRYIPDRSAFLDKSTLKNCQAGLENGVAFMGKHDTGGWMQSGSYPIGRTFAARYETNGGVSRVLFGAYMVRGINPNGAREPSADDLKRMMDAGQLSDNSLGLRGGEQICTVCGKELYAYDEETYEYECPHIPGTRYRMSEAEIKAQVALGVPDGVAAYRLCNAVPGELSAVYDGAIPGAGITKTLAIGVLTGEQLAARGQGGARMSFGANVRSLLRGFGIGGPEPASVDHTETEAPADTEDTPMADEHVDMTIELEMLRKRNEELEAELQMREAAAVEAAAVAVVEEAVRSMKLMPSGRDEAIKLAVKDMDGFKALLASIPERAEAPSSDDVLHVDPAASKSAPADELHRLALERSSSTGVQYHVAFKAIIAERPDLAAAVREPASE